MFEFLRSFFQKQEIFRNLPAAQFLALAKSTPNAVLLDVRTAEEVAAGHLDGMRNLDYKNPSFASHVAKLDQSATYFVYCRSGVRSANACRIMHGLGFHNLVNLEGGYLSVTK